MVTTWYSVVPTKDCQFTTRHRPAATTMMEGTDHDDSAAGSSSIQQSSANCELPLHVYLREMLRNQVKTRNSNPDIYTVPALRTNLVKTCR